MPDEIQEQEERSPLLDGQGEETEGLENPEEVEVPSDEPDPIDIYRDLGFTDVESAEDGQARLAEAYRQQQEQLQRLQYEQQQLSQLAQYGNQYLQQQQQSQEPEPQQEDSWWSPPQVNVDLVQQYRVRDEHGNYQWRQDTPPELRLQAEAHERYIEQWADRLVREPQKVLPEIISKEFDRLFEERYSQRVSEERKLARIQQIQKENQGWMYEKDPRTNQPARNPDGTYRFSPAGEAAMHFASEAEQYGITDPDRQWAYVTRMLQAMSAQQPRKDPRMEHLQRHASNPPDRSGSQETPEQPMKRPQNPNQSPGETLVELLAAEGQM